MDVGLMDKVERASGRKEKETILSEADKGTIDFIATAVDPAITFGLTADSDEIIALYRAHRSTSGPFCTPDVWWYIMRGALGTWARRAETGNAASSKLHELAMMAPREADVKWMCRIVNKDLRCGVSVKTLNNVFPGTVVPFSVALAEQFDPETLDELDHDDVVFVEPKLDGLRMVAIRPDAFTRNGKRIISVDHVLEQLNEIRYTMGVDLVFDGEIMGGGDDFDRASGAVRRHEKNENAVYHVFDVMSRDEWTSRSSGRLSLRKDDLSKVAETIEELGCTAVKVVKWKQVVGSGKSATVFRLQEEYEKNGYEGAMVKLNRPYSWKRTSDIQKVKSFLDADCTIVGVLEGKGRLEGTLGSLVVELDGKKSRVGSGFSDAQRAVLFDRRDELEGLVCTVKYQNLSANGSMRFPVFVCLRSDLD